MSAFPGCVHNHRWRFTSGFQCEEPSCHRFVAEGTVEYFYHEELSSIWMVLHNRCVGAVRGERTEDLDVAAMKKRVWNFERNRSRYTLEKITEFRDELYAFLNAKKIGRDEASFTLG